MKGTTRILRSRIIVEHPPGIPVPAIRKQDVDKEDTNLELHSLCQKLRSQEPGAHRKLRMDLEVL